MTKRAFIPLALVLVSIVGVVMWQVLPLAQPSCQGKSLAVWLGGYDQKYGSPEWQRSDEALRHMGTNTIPLLLQMLRLKDAPLKLKLLRLFQKQHVIRIHSIPDSTWNLRAGYAFGGLEAKAKDAVPALVAIYDENRSTSSRCGVTWALAFIGPAAKPAIPSLLRGMASSNEMARFNALFALGRIHGDAERVVPILIKSLHDPSRAVRNNALSALRSFGKDAAPALPELIAFIEDTNNASERIIAESALRGIDPSNTFKRPGQPIPSRDHSNE